jgi:hypothetical protein
VMTAYTIDNAPARTISQSAVFMEGSPYKVGLPPARPLAAAPAQNIGAHASLPQDWSVGAVCRDSLMSSTGITQQYEHSNECRTSQIAGKFP